MSLRISKEVWEHSKASKTVKLVLLAFAWHADDDGLCWPSIGRIAKMVGLSKRQSKESIKKLIELGELLPVSNRNGGRGRSTRYRVVVEKGEVRSTVSAKKDEADSTLSLKKGEVRSTVLSLKGEETSTKGCSRLHPNSKEQSLKNRKVQNLLNLPPELDTPKARETWNEFLVHRSEIRKRVTVTGANRIFQKFEKLGASVFIEALDRSIQNGYQGVFSPNENKFKNSREPRDWTNASQNDKLKFAAGR